MRGLADIWILRLETESSVKVIQISIRPKCSIWCNVSFQLHATAVLFNSLSRVDWPPDLQLNPFPKKARVRFDESVTLLLMILRNMKVYVISHLRYDYFQYFHDSWGSHLQYSPPRWQILVSYRASACWKCFQRRFFFLYLLFLQLVSFYKTWCDAVLQNMTLRWLYIPGVQQVVCVVS